MSYPINCWIRSMRQILFNLVMISIYSVKCIAIFGPLLCLIIELNDKLKFLYEFVVWNICVRNIVAPLWSSFKVVLEYKRQIVNKIEITLKSTKLLRKTYITQKNHEIMTFTSIAFIDTRKLDERWSKQTVKNSHIST